MVRQQGHERLTVYGQALTLVERLEQFAQNIPERRLDLRDQIRRASSSVVLNIAEGADEFSAKDKARFYRMARRSAAECSAILDVCVRTAPPCPTAAEEQRMLQEVRARLSRLIASVESRK